MHIPNFRFSSTPRFLLMSSAPSSSTPAPQLSGRALLAAAIAVNLTAMLLRGPVTCIGPMADAIVKTFGITYPEYGTLAALPIAAFGIFSFLPRGWARGWASRARCLRRSSFSLQALRPVW